MKDKVDKLILLILTWGSDMIHKDAWRLELNTLNTFDYSWPGIHNIK